MTDFNAVMDRYLAVWNEPDATTRRKAVDDLFADGIRYVDPLAAIEGREALTALIGAVQEQFPGHTFALGGPLDAHHDQMRFTWTLTAGPGEPLVIGFDVAELDADGRIRQVLGFIDKAPG